MQQLLSSKPPSLCTPPGASHVPLHAAMRSVFVYNGPGAGSRSVLSTRESLQRVLKEDVKVELLSSPELLSRQWLNKCALLVFPGGADLPYCRELNGTGNEIIREYVVSGGSYLGLCAGAYYACRHIEFEVGDPVLEVVGDRELGFFPGLAVGSTYKGFDYLSEAGAKAAPLRFVSSYHLEQEPQQGHGAPLHPHSREESCGNLGAGKALQGCEGLSPSYFRFAEGDDEVDRGQASNGSLQRGKDISTEGVGKVNSVGSTSGSGLGNNDAIHTGGTAWSRCLDYCNGGCVFRVDQLPHSHSRGRGSRVQQHQQGRPAQSTQEHCHPQASDVSYAAVNGSDYAPSASAVPEQGSQPSISVLAEYEDLGPGAAAAVRCCVGSGVAVLCGTHPELEPHWLDRAAGAAPQGAEVNAVAHEAAEAGDAEAARKLNLLQHTSSLAAALQHSQKSRHALWRTMLEACCNTFTQV